MKALRFGLQTRGGRAAISLLVLVGGLAWLRCGPLPEGLLGAAASQSTVVVDRNGVPLYEALSGDGTRAVALRAGTVPDLAAAATVAAEDRRFWSHRGVDLVAIVRAARRNLVEGRIAEGGSTISQQVAKGLLLRQAPGGRRGWGAKIREAVVAIRLEHRLTKREILALYLNIASYGNQISGYERASRAYFGTTSGMLTPAQAAFLAGLPQRPTTFNPYKHRDLAISRQRVILARMVRTGSLSSEASRQAREEHLEFQATRRPFLAPHFVEMVLARAGSERPPRIVTTLDAGLQDDVAGIIRSHRATLERHGAANAAVVVLDNSSGEWRAWEGSGDYLDQERGGRIDGAMTLRQPGSALKPFTYALAFEQGVTPATVLPDVPMHFPTAEQGVVYSPRNYDGRYRGPLRARAALAGSENIPAVALAADLGVPALVRFLHRAGFSTFEKSAAHYGLGVTLGNAEVRLDELVTAYAALARGGEWMPSTYEVRGNRGVERRRLVSSRSAFWVTSILSDDEARAYIFGRGGSLEFPFPVAVKTGTSQAYHDNWTVGYTPRLTVGVWVGNFDRRPLRNSSGVTGAAPIFQAVMLAAHNRLSAGESTTTPNDPSVERREICALSGEEANAWCPAQRREWVASASEHVLCSWHHLEDGRLLVVWPAQYRDWARVNGLLQEPARRDARQGRMAGRPARLSTAAPAPRPLEIASPPDGATYMIDPTLRREFQTLQLRAVTHAPAMVTWSIDGAALGESSSEAPLEWPLRAGRHTIAARDQHGNTVESVVIVR